MLHLRTHPEYVEGCFACRAGTVHVSAQATPTRRPHPVSVDAKEAEWSKDMAAYKRLRSEGFQPKGIDGADRLEATSASREQIEAGA